MLNFSKKKKTQLSTQTEIDEYEHGNQMFFLRMALLECSCSIEFVTEIKCEACR